MVYLLQSIFRSQIIKEAKHSVNLFREYDTLQLQLESSMSRIENEVKQYQEEILANETKNNLMELKKMQLDLLEKRANDEVKLYVSNKVCFKEYNLMNI